MTHTYVVADVVEAMAAIPDGTVDLVLTSPPFLCLRSYLPADHPDKAHEIGSEATPADFISTLLGLTATWRDKLAPHGTLAVELGDTYAGQGQETFTGSARKVTAGRRRDREPVPANATGGHGWPMDKSLSMVPEAYRIALAYGLHPLTGEPSPAGRWRVRNVVDWCRPNPPVGSLADKFRPSTSDLVIACTARDRWFDLDGVRVASRTVGGRARGPKTGEAAEDGRSRLGDFTAGHAERGAPPLDHWVISPSGYTGSHYAVFPPALCRTPIEAMCPRRVCRTCGVPSRRLVAGTSWPEDDRDRDPERLADIGGARHGHRVADPRTLGWTTCGCPGTGDMWDDGWIAAEAEITTAIAASRRRGVTTAEKTQIKAEVLPPLYDRLAAMYRGRIDGYHRGDGWRPGLVLDPFGGSGTVGLVAGDLGRDSLLIDIDERNLHLARERVGMFLQEATIADLARMSAVAA